ncbi:DUF4258 domain-containing protein [Robertkochia aurantiaca]|uniref:DUF4258 domain-containing protein n=1 Tax=Robertkochia aurantiaca TaxID=2873700 RepID=UPI001CC944AB|nr:DUF4258 domain-containing protein [Robertkochia sp. 3YJGBD-33]
MPLLKKIGFYLIGLSLGIIFLAYFFKGKNTEFCYFPNCRVLKDIRANELTYSDEFEKLMQLSRVSKEDIQAILQNGTVDFSKSNTEDKPCKEYYIEGNLDEAEVAITVDRCDSVSVLKTLQLIPKEK